MRKFMASLDKELERRSSGGEIVLVGEAVLTKNVPDITDKLKEAVYASGVARPKQASALELQQLEQQAMLAAQPQQPMTAQPAAPVGYPDRSEEHTSELQSLMRISSAVFCLNKKKQKMNNQQRHNTQ